MSQHDLVAKSCSAHNFLIWSQILKLFHRINHHIESMCREQHLGRYLEGQGHSMTLQQNRVRPITSFFEVRLKIYFTEMINILRRCVANNIWFATLKVKVTTWPCSTIVSGHNFVIWCRILKLFHRNDHHIETMCRAHHLGCYLEGQGHSMTLQQNRIQLITLLFDVRFYNHFWQITSLCPKPIRGALPGSTGSCFNTTPFVFFKDISCLYLKPINFCTFYNQFVGLSCYFISSLWKLLLCYIKSSRKSLLQSGKRNTIEIWASIQ